MSHHIGEHSIDLERDIQTSEHETGRPQKHDYSLRHEKRTKFVIVLTGVTMVLEIVFGYLTNSMALLADGWHMSTHTFAIGLTWGAYIVSRKYSRTEKFSFSKEKVLALSGFTSAIVLEIVAVSMIIQSFNRLLNPLTIKFSQAIFIAVIGLIVNGISALLLHRDYEHHDHNVRSAYVHVLADGLTSVTAIIALTVGLFFNLYFLDAVSGMISSLVITKWSVDLIRNSGKELIDFHRKQSSI